MTDPRAVLFDVDGTLIDSNITAHLSDQPAATGVRI